MKLQFSSMLFYSIMVSDQKLISFSWSWIFPVYLMATHSSSSSDAISSSSRLTDAVIQITIPLSTKLDQDNFLTWRYQVEPIIHGFDLSHHIDNSPPPEKLLTMEGVSTSNPRFPLWNKQDQFLLTWLRSTISKPILSQYVAYKIANSL